jgi:hypothetical protein
MRERRTVAARAASTGFVNEEAMLSIEEIWALSVDSDELVD